MIDSICIQLYERRKKVLKSTKEKKKFQQIDYKYMTEESVSEDDDDVIRTHKLQWRSASKPVHVASYPY